jgi:cysteinyl-tRNA synthetase
MLDDLNTPIALASLGELARLGNDVCDLAQKRKKDAAFSAAAAATARELLTLIDEILGWLGLLQADYATYQARTKARRAKCRGLSLSQIETKIAERAQARQNKDFARSDSLRDELLSLGVLVKDSPEGQLWSLEV